MPSVASRMKKVLHKAGQGIDTTQIWPLVKIATMACQREVVDVVGAAMLLGNHMLDMMQQFSMILVQTTIFAPLSGCSRTNRRVVASIIAERSGQDVDGL